MSKNIIIQEGGTNYQFTAKKLKTDKVGGGSVLWVPEEETVLKKKKITEEGTYKASDEGVYGYSEVQVDVTGSGSVHGKRITQNGTYKAEDDGYIGYSKVKVNVRGGNGSADNSGRPRITFDSDGNIEDAPGGIGSALSGIDPSTGEWITVGVDNSGNLVLTPAPAGIEIITPPTKTSYVKGETINYSGIVVSLKNNSGGTFTDSTYPNGHIPMQELLLPIQIAPSGEGSSISVPLAPQMDSNEAETKGIAQAYVDSYSHPKTNLNVGVSTGVNFSWFFYNDSNGKTRRVDVASSNNGVLYQCYVNQESSNYKYLSFSLSGFTGYTGSNGVTIYYVDWSLEEFETYIPLSGSSFNDLNSGLEYMTQNLVGSNAHTIPVQWKSRYNDNTFEDSFEITVTEGSGSGSTDGGGYSDDSGGSSSGGGGGF